ncbi:NAD-dependent epimerase/dehydratase family protein [Arachnia rubra]|jgi:hypothetical protein|uniref:NAD(P)-dependent oxidoreductase n=1 Tax=Arachnia rubra TaxID=1547448 RepID=A0ABX7Y8F5_9ACTN|nr:NAD(P)-dependent oxidoreductase [Arachnia rubra]QUC09072.1 NAD(P)-dependent oxidoreductase [Arachnia rubra]BCR80522.1 CDP-glucose 4,6-dehydratase [Arachnia rubra]
MSDAWSGLRCLVTGGAGFGGRRLVDELICKGAEVTVLDRRLGTRACPEVDYVVGDVRDDALVRTLLRTRHVDAVFHLAAEALVPYSVAHPAEVLDVNARGTYVMLEAWRQERPDARFIFASSGAYYGDTTSSEPLPESASPLAAANLYASSKAAADLAVQGYAATYDLRAAVCRFMNTYGPGDTHRSRLVPRALALLASAGPFDFGNRDDGTSALDFLYIDDMVSGYLAVAEHLEYGDSGAFNFGSGRCVPIAEVATRASVVWDGLSRVPVFSGARRAAPRRKWLDIRKARDLLGWEPRTDLDTGLAATVRWFREAKRGC